MLWFIGPNRQTPYGRHNGVIYYPGVLVAVDYSFFAVDLTSGNMVQVPTADMPGGPPAGPAGGDLAGTYPNPTVATVSDSALSANVPVMSGGVLPAVDGSLLTNLPASAVGGRGTCIGLAVTLDAAGQANVTSGVDFPNPLPGASFMTFALTLVNGIGPLRLSPGTLMPDATLTVISDASSVDSGTSVIVIVVYC